MISRDPALLFVIQFSVGLRELYSKSQRKLFSVKNGLSTDIVPRDS